METPIWVSFLVTSSNFFMIPDTQIELYVEEGDDRVDRWLSSQLPDLSRSRLQKLIEQGHLKLNGVVCLAKKAPVQPGDRLQVNLPSPEPLELLAEDIPLDILYEDEHLIIINKAANMVVHPAPGHYQGTLVNALLFHCQDLSGIGGVQRPGIVHRLDKDTTGAIVVAKTDFALQHLQKQIQSKTARREYLGVVHGSPSNESGKVDLPIGRNSSDRKKMAVVSIEKGRNAVTEWQIVERLGNYTLMHFQLDTGRTHQIRVHCSALGYPIVGDPNYSAGRSVGVNLDGQVLHAWKLTLEHPLSGEIISAVAPLPENFSKLLVVLRDRQN